MLFGGDPVRQKYHDDLAEKYRLAARFPFVPIPVDPPGPPRTRIFGRAPWMATAIDVAAKAEGTNWKANGRHDRGAAQSARNVAESLPRASFSI